MMLESYKRQIYNCGRCGYCLGGYLDHVCPSRFIGGFESATARGRMLIARALLERKLNYSKELVSVLFKCFLCGACDVKCNQAAKIKITEITKAMRADAVETGVILEKLVPAAKTLNESHNIYGKPSTERTFLTQSYQKKGGASDLLYFPGCVITFRYPKIAQNTLQILKVAGVDFILLGEDEWCCGNPFFFMGMSKEAKRFALHNIEAIRSKGVKVVLTSCAGCYRVLSQEYPKIFGGKLPFKVMHVTQFLSKLVNEGSLKLKRTKYDRVTYHDPCEIGRYGGIYDEPREIIQSVPNLKLAEMNKSRDDSWCCGGGGSVNIVHTNLALLVSALRIKQAQETGAKVLVTACPTCVQMLELASKRAGAKIHVVDIASLVLEAIKT
ncbi:MAG: (Fe-S)-binding protein [Candidatus Bathyarchaeia archaeon]